MSVDFLFFGHCAGVNPRDSDCLNLSHCRVKICVVSKKNVVFLPNSARIYETNVSCFKIFNSEPHVRVFWDHMQEKKLMPAECGNQEVCTLVKSVKFVSGFGLPSMTCDS